MSPTLKGMGPHVLRYKVEWTGFTGAPGYTNFFFGSTGDFFTPDDVSQPVAKIDAFLNSLNPLLPAGANIKLDSTVETIKIDDASLVDFDGITPFARGNASGTGNYSAASGGVVSWYTAGIRNNRRVRGRTFLVPLAGSALAANGQVAAGTVSTLQSAADLLRVPTASGCQLYIYGRPTAIKDANGKPTGAYNADGVAFPVQTARVPSKVAVLRSRRD